MSSCTEHPRVAANRLPRNRPTTETPTLRQALPEQTKPREGNLILPPDFSQFRYSTSYSMNLTHCSKNLVLNQWPQQGCLKEWAVRGPKVKVTSSNEWCICMEQRTRNFRLSLQDWERIEQIYYILPINASCFIYATHCQIFILI